GRGNLRRPLPDFPGEILQAEIDDLLIPRGVGFGESFQVALGFQKPIHGLGALAGFFQGLSLLDESINLEEFRIDRLRCGRETERSEGECEPNREASHQWNASRRLLDLATGEPGLERVHGSGGTLQWWTDLPRSANGTMCDDAIP